MLRKILFTTCLSVCAQARTEAGFTALFNGKDLAGWKAGDNAGTFTVEDGAIITRGARSHLFYAGDSTSMFSGMMNCGSTL